MKNKDLRYKLSSKSLPNNVPCCPYCWKTFYKKDQTSCPHCDFSNHSHSSYIEGTPPPLAPIIDYGSIIEKNQKKRMLKMIQKLHTKYPDLNFSFCLSGFEATVKTSMVGFWILNEQTPSDELTVETIINTVLIVYDTDNKCLSLTKGYGIEPYLLDEDFHNCIPLALQSFNENAYDKGLDIIITQIYDSLKEFRKFLRKKHPGMKRSSLFSVLMACFLAFHSTCVGNQTQQIQELATSLDIDIRLYDCVEDSKPSLISAQREWKTMTSSASQNSYAIFLCQPENTEISAFFTENTEFPNKAIQLLAEEQYFIRGTAKTNSDALKLFLESIPTIEAYLKNYDPSLEFSPSTPKQKPKIRDLIFSAIAGTAVFALASLLVGKFIISRRKYFLPTYRYIPRLGAPYTGGTNLDSNHLKENRKSRTRTQRAGGKRKELTVENKQQTSTSV